MKFQEIVSPSLKDLFVRQIEAMILRGELAVGEKLPNERDLAGQMNISRSIVNSGMQELADKGFLRIVPRQGAFVEDYILNGNILTLVALLRSKGGRFDPKLLHSFIDFRRDLETVCAERAAERRSEEQLEALRQKMASLKEAMHTDAFTAESLAFHKLLFVATGNLVYPLIFNAFYEILDVISRQLFRLVPHEDVVRNLESILAAVERGDADDAGRRMRAHVDECSELLVQHVE